MCGRFVQRYAEELAERFMATPLPGIAEHLTPRYNIAPTQRILAVLRTADGQRQLDLLRWGLATRRPPGEKAPLIFNARAETLIEKPTFRRLLPRQRCLVPASGFYEWEKVGRDKLPWLFELADGAPFAFAGLYDWMTGERGAAMLACTLITTAPNDLVASVHNRMPVILPRDREAAWLDPERADPGDLVPLLGPYPANGMRRVAVSRAVNDSRIDRPELIEPVSA